MKKKTSLVLACSALLVLTTGCNRADVKDTVTSVLDNTTSTVTDIKEDLVDSYDILTHDTVPDYLYIVPEKDKARTVRIDISNSRLGNANVTDKACGNFEIDQAYKVKVHVINAKSIKAACAKTGIFGIKMKDDAAKASTYITSKSNNIVGYVKHLSNNLYVCLTVNVGKAKPAVAKRLIQDVVMLTDPSIVANDQCKKQFVKFNTIQSEEKATYGLMLDATEVACISIDNAKAVLKPRKGNASIDVEIAGDGTTIADKDACKRIVKVNCSNVIDEKNYVIASNADNVFCYKFDKAGNVGTYFNYKSKKAMSEQKQQEVCEMFKRVAVCKIY